MMKKVRLTLIVAVLSLLATGLFPSNLGAQTWSPQYEFLAAGSSAQFNATGFAALDPAANTLGGKTACTAGNNSLHWTATSGMAVHDPRGNPNIADETGSVWIGWDPGFIAVMDYDMSGGGPSPPGGAPASGTVAQEGIICTYVSLDSVVGMREYFVNGQFVLSATAGTADTLNVIPGLPAGSSLPAEVVYFFTTLGPQVLNVAPTDIRPEDGKFATVRALTTLGTQMPGPAYAGLGYGPGPVGTRIKSNLPGSSKFMQVADFAMDPREVDPITLGPARTYQVLPVGAAPVLVIANTTQTGTGHLGNAEYSQINHNVLADIFSGKTHEIRDIGNYASSDPIVPITVFEREPLSGTYNTFDFNVTCSFDHYSGYGGANYYACMETDVNPATQNPLDLTYTISTGGTSSRQRVIGTGEMIKAVCGYTSGSGGYGATGEADSIGFVFWGFANFKGLTGNCKYLPVDNIDPLYLYPSANPTGNVGGIPTCTWATGQIGCPVLPFNKIVDGAYPIWTMYRWVAAYGPQVYANGVLAYLELVAGTYLTDFVPSANMLVFRQHYTQCVTTAACDAEYGGNGVDVTSILGSVCGPGGNLACVEGEYGGDMGGKVLTVNSEIDYAADQFKNGTTSGCTAAVWPDYNYPGVCMQTSLDLGNHHLPPW